MTQLDLNGDVIPQKLCACGCGKPVTNSRNKYITGHNMSCDAGREEQSKRKIKYHLDHPECRELYCEMMRHASHVRWSDHEQHDEMSDRMKINNPMGDIDVRDHHKNIMVSSEYRDKLSSSLKRYYSDPEARERQSAALQGQDYSAGEWTGFAPGERDYILPINQCLQVNDWFFGCNAHHITKSIVAFIPTELHRHIRHNLKTGSNMGEMNALAIQFINGGL